jgi:DnaJ-class molecular chaperone
MGSINIDWGEEFKDNFDKWENKTQNVLRSILEDKENEKFKEVAERLEVLNDEGNLQEYYEESLDSYNPMMNFGYSLETEPNDEDILKVALNTNCSIMYNTETNENFIVLNGGGMDLSQDIGLSYVFIENWIPEDFINNISTQKGLSISEENFEILKKAIIEQSKNYSNRFKDLNKRWKELK